jgi:maleamate amidohydrolase
MDFRDVIPTEDMEAYVKAGFGRRMGFGKKPCVIVIDMTYGFVDPKYPLAHGNMGLEAIKHIQLLLATARRN